MILWMTKVRQRYIQQQGILDQRPNLPSLGWCFWNGRLQRLTQRNHMSRPSLRERSHGTSYRSSFLSRSGSCPVLRKMGPVGPVGPADPRAPSHSPSILMATGCNLWVPKSWTASEHRLGDSQTKVSSQTSQTFKRDSSMPSLVPSGPSSPTFARGAKMSDKIDRSGAGPCGPCLLPLEALSQPPVASTTSPFRNREMMEKASPGNASSGLSIGSVSPKFQTEGSPKGPPGQEPLVPPTRVAVVGAGPVGLWIAVLLARAHARFFQTSSGFRISRHPQAPVINVIWAARTRLVPQFLL